MSKHGHSAFAHGPEVHVVPHGDPEPNGVGQHHDEVKILNEVKKWTSASSSTPTWKSPTPWGSESPWGTKCISGPWAKAE